MVNPYEAMAPPPAPGHMGAVMVREVKESVVASMRDLTYAGATT